MKSFICLMRIGKQCLMQSAILKSLAMMVYIQEVDENAQWNLPIFVRSSKKWVQWNSRVSMRKIVHEMEISDQSVWQIVKTELGLKPYKLQKLQLLKWRKIFVQLKRCWKFLRWAASQWQKRFLFTDEHLYTIKRVHNSPNNTMCICRHSRHLEIRWTSPKTIVGHDLEQN